MDCLGELRDELDADVDRRGVPRIPRILPFFDRELCTQQLLDLLGVTALLQYCDGLRQDQLCDVGDVGDDGYGGGRRRIRSVGTKRVPEECRVVA